MNEMIDKQESVKQGRMMRIATAVCEKLFKLCIFIEKQITVNTPTATQDFFPKNSGKTLYELHTFFV